MSHTRSLVRQAPRIVIALAARRSGRARRASLRLVGALVMLVGVLAVPAVARAQTVLAPVREMTLGASFGGGGTFYGVSCVSSGNCTAVGNDKNGKPIVDTESGGTWGTPIEISGVGGSSLSFSNFNGVSCVSVGNCTAVGVSGAGLLLVVVESGGTWGTPITMTQLGELIGVSCVSVGNCAAVGYDDANGQPIHVEEIGGVWGTPVESPVNTSGPGGSTSLFYSVSCELMGFCSAVGIDQSELPFVVSEAGFVWGTPTEISSSLGVLGGVSCVSAGNCTAAGNDGAITVVEQSGGIWGALQHLTASNPSTYGISCVSAGNCTVAGSIASSPTAFPQPFLLTKSNGTWGTPTQVPLGFGLGGEAEFRAVSCVSAVNCTAVGVDFNGQPIFYQRPPGPYLVISPLTAASAFDYGTILAGHTKTQTFKVTNVGFKATPALGVTVSGAQAARFVKGSDLCAGIHLAPAKTCTLKMTYTPGAGVGQSDAATLTVNTGQKATTLHIALTGRTGPCLVTNTRTNTDFATLQQANDATTTSSPDNLTAQGVCSGTTTITKDLTIDGSATLRSRNGRSTVLFISQASVVSLTGSLTIQDGGDTGIANGGSLYLTGTTVTGNSGTFGGGISNNGELTLLGDTQITGNSAQDGGGIYNAGSVTLGDNSTVVDNTASDAGGGIYNNGTGTLTACGAGLNEWFGAISPNIPDDPPDIPVLPC